MRHYENIEKLFTQDIIEKKRTGRGAFHMRGKGVKHGFSGALKTPYHYMTAKEKRNLNGEVRVSNMFTTILNWTEFEAKDLETQKQLMTKWREIYSNKEIMKVLSEGRPSKLSNQSYNELIKKLDCPKKRKALTTATAKPKAKRVEKNAESISPQLTFEELQTPVVHNEPQKEEVVKSAIVLNGLHLEYNGKYDVENLTKLFTKLQLLIDGETNQYHISLSLSEIPEEKA